MCILAVDFYVEEESHSYCVEIEKSPKKTKKLRFGPAQLLKKIEFLSSQEGYCWAEDKHFAQEFDVDISTINRWIRTLKEFELIKTESKNVLTANGWRTKRKTYVLKKSLRNPQNKGPATLNVEGPINKPIKEETTTKEKEIKKEKGGGVVFFEENLNPPSDEEKFEAKEIAKKFKQFASEKDKNRNSEWEIPEELILSLIGKDGAPYVIEQCQYIYNQQTRAEKDEIEGVLKKTPKIDKPRHSLSLACSKNYALAKRKKKE